MPDARGGTPWANEGRGSACCTRASRQAVVAFAPLLAVVMVWTILYAVLTS